jgi:DNA-binding transcriptional LysR family regulator
MGLDGVCQMVEAGVGVAIVPESTARRAVTSMKLSRVRLRDAWAHPRLVVCAKSFKSLSKPASELVQQLRSIAQARTRRH